MRNPRHYSLTEIESLALRNHNEVLRRAVTGAIATLVLYVELENEVAKEYVPQTIEKVRRVAVKENLGKRAEKKLEEKILDECVIVGEWF